MSENACMLMATTDLVGQKVEKHNSRRQKILPV
jgi:hypothetical protein